MNTLTGEITAITTEQNISLVIVLAGGQLFYSLILDTPDTSPWLKTGASVRLLFKETEVMIALPVSTPLQISVRNQIPCHIAAIVSGAILCELTLALNSSAPADSPVQRTIKAIITRAACDALSLKENDPIIALIKTNEVSLAHD
ncbi:MAG TPA: TOBE domain-containing protein [Puia sp.]|jgi:molybdopterin-binding protein